MKRILWFSIISLICSVARGQGVGGNGVPGAGSGGGGGSYISPNSPNGMNSTGVCSYRHQLQFQPVPLPGKLLQHG